MGGRGWVGEGQRQRLSQGWFYQVLSLLASKCKQQMFYQFAKVFPKCLDLINSEKIAKSTEQNFCQENK